VAAPMIVANGSRGFYYTVAGNQASETGLNVHAGLLLQAGLLLKILFNKYNGFFYTFVIIHLIAKIGTG
jgi:hypothetical protein